jgi:phage terminase large subunit
MELTAPRYKIASDGRVQMESKEDMKKRGVASPNLADALCLTFFPELGDNKVWQGWI